MTNLRISASPDLLFKRPFIDCRATGRLGSRPLSSAKEVCYVRRDPRSAHVIALGVTVLGLALPAPLSAHETKSIGAIRLTSGGIDLGSELYL